MKSSVFVLLHALVLPLLLLPSLAKAADQHEVTHLTVIQKTCEDENGKLFEATRSFEFDRAPRLLVVDAETLETQMIDPSSLHCERAGLEKEFEDSRFGRALMTASLPPFPMVNDGMHHSTTSEKGVFLTGDLCPAKEEKFKHRLFNELESIAGKKGEPTPIALAVTGRWIRKHSADFDEILHLIAEKKIEVTWMNHSDTHPYIPGFPSEINFLLTPGIDPEAEIENVEIELLKRGQIPSVFFRFPGLVSNQTWIENLRRHSLIAIGSDAWLAFNQIPKTGSIILVHANGNEPKGVTLFLDSVLSIEALGPFLPLSKLF